MCAMGWWGIGGEHFRNGNCTGEECDGKWYSEYRKVCDLIRFTFTNDHIGYNELNSWASVFYSYELLWLVLKSLL